MSKLKVVVEGTKSDGEKFRKEIETDSEMLSLNNNQLSSLDLAPLAKCTELQLLSLDENPLSSLDLAPLEKCTGLIGLQELKLDASTTIRWDSPNLTVAKLPKGLEEYREEIQRAWEEFTKAEQERK